MMRSFIFFICILLCKLSPAQEILWQKSYGGTSWDELRNVLHCSDGGFLVSGFSSSDSSGEKTENSNGGLDFWIFKTDSMGSILWQNTIGGSGEDRAFEAIETYNGGYLIGGYSYSPVSGDKSEDSIGKADYWIVKIDSMGTIQWQNTIGGSDDDFLNNVVETFDHGFLLGGLSYSPISGDKTEDSLGLSDYWLVKVDSVGNILWQNVIGGSSFDMQKCLIQTVDSNILIGGWSNSTISGDKTDPHLGSSDLWILKLDQLGGIIWQQTIGGADADQLMSFLECKDGGFILGGASSSNASFDKTEDSKGGFDFWILKLDNNGNILWQKTWGGEDEDVCRTVSEFEDGSLLFSGYSYSGRTGNKTEDSFGDVDYWILRLDSAGSFKSQKSFGGNKKDFLYLGLALDQGNYLLGGFSKSELSGLKSSTSSSDDYWILKVTENENFVSGFLFADSNLDLVRDSLEPPISFKLINDIITNRFTFSQSDGSYQLSVLDTGTFTWSAPTIPYFASTPLFFQSHFSTWFQVDSLIDFAYRTVGNSSDLRVRLNRMGSFKPYSHSYYAISCENNGHDTISPVITFYKDASLQFISSVPSPAAVYNDSIQWILPPLRPFDYTNIYIQVRLDSSISLPFLISSSVKEQHIATDKTPFDNFHSIEILAGDSLLESSMVVDVDSIPFDSIGLSPFLEYTIYFTNLGLDTVHRLLVLHNIPLMERANTFELMAASHPLTLHYEMDNRLLRFDFDSIELTDTITDSFNAHGFLRYRIRVRPNLLSGSTIYSRAFFYFDGGQPVVTDTATTVIFSMVGIYDAEKPNIVNVYPNPASDLIFIPRWPLQWSGITSFSIFDLSGRLLKYGNFSATSTEDYLLSIADLESGIYILEIQNSLGKANGKFVKP